MTRYLGVGGACVLVYLAAVLSGLPAAPTNGQFIHKLPADTPDPLTAHLWVDTDGGTCVDNASPVVYNTATACGTIDAAANAADAGDIVRVKAGTYAERVTPGDGSAGNPTTFVADGAVTACGVDLSSNDHLRFIDFVFDTNAGGCTINNGAVVASGTNTFIEFWNNTFRDANYNAIRTTGTINNSILIGNVATAFGIGNFSGTAFNINGDDNLSAYNEVYGVDPDAFAVSGSENYFLNNYVHDMLEDGGGHPDFFQNANETVAWSFNTVEGNLQIGSGTPNDHVSNLEAPSVAWTENIFRRNVWHSIGSGTLGIHNIAAGFTFLRYYHNTTAMAQTSTSNAEAGIFAYGTGIDDTYTYNNIEYQAWSSDRTTGIAVYYVEGTHTSNYNLAYDPDGSVSFAAAWTNQANEQSNVNPNFVNYATDNFTLAAGSGDGANARGTSGPLTTTSGSGTGTTFSVATSGGGFFRGDNTGISQYGGALAVGDTITVGTDVVTIASISGDAITATALFTWANGESVYYGNDATPDLGAYPYKSGGYTLSATYSVVGSTATITPNDANLVRFAVCFENGIPTTVDNATPYTCNVTAGTSRVFRVYPLYPSKTLWVVATP